MQKLFVYGTLKRGCSNHHFLFDQTFLGEAVTQPRYRMLDLGGYPGLIKDDEGTAIKGELWEIDAPCLERVDILEGVEAGLYARSPARLSGEHEDWEDVILYVFLGNPAAYPVLGDEWDRNREYGW